MKQSKSKSSSTRIGGQRVERRTPPVKQEEADEGIKETADSIVVAFILAFVFRAFIVEAFVIPTGSMAATLYGKHGTLVCSDCGWENVYGLTDLTTRQPQFDRDAVVRCQNCNHSNTGLTIHDRVGRRGNAESGDRILVFKWPLNIGADTLGPQRWDVTVFKNPSNGNENYIKRLVGLPGEVLEIIDGDVYSVAAEQLSEKTLQILEERRRLKYQLRTNQAIDRKSVQRLARGAPPAVLDELADKLTIQAKSPAAQESSWTVVYNHDYPPRVLDDGQPHWRPDASADRDWRTTNRRLSFDGAGGGEATVRYAGKSIANHNVYNIDVRPGMWVPVSDLRIEAVLHLKGGDGFLEFVLPKNGDAFAARLHADGRVALIRYESDGRPTEGTTLSEATISPLSPDAPVAIALQNVDYRVSLLVDGREILATSPQQYPPDISALRKQSPKPARMPWVTAADVDLELRHVVLYRDAFYTSPSQHFQINRRARMSGWATTGHPILLREGEYFMLGDNSPKSKDSRLWDVVGPHLTERGEGYQMGTVPYDQIIGRAFFVYWPSGLRPDWLPLFRNFGIIPNVGEMRWIQ